MLTPDYAEARAAYAAGWKYAGTSPRVRCHTGRVWDWFFASRVGINHLPHQEADKLTRKDALLSSRQPLTQTNAAQGHPPRALGMTGELPAAFVSVINNRKP